MLIVTMMVMIFFGRNILLLLHHVPRRFAGFAKFAGFAGFAKMLPGKRHGAPELGLTGFPLGYGDLAERLEFAVPDVVGVPGVNINPVQTHCRTLSEGVPLQNPPRRTLRSQLANSAAAEMAPSAGLGQESWCPFSVSGGYFCRSCLDNADSAKIIIP